jgi:hypothetical protein
VSDHPLSLPGPSEEGSRQVGRLLFRIDHADSSLASRRSAVLNVPSAIVPESRNLLLNVANPDAGRARIASIRPFAFDGPPDTRLPHNERFTTNSLASGT